MADAWLRPLETYVRFAFPKYVRYCLYMPISASKLRANVYALLDNVLKTGKPLIIERRGGRLAIHPEQPPSKLARLTRREDFVQGDPDELIHMDWSDEWKPDFT